MIAPDLLAELKPARVLLVGRTGTISRLIRAVTHSDYSHVAMIAESAGAWIVLEATTDVSGVAARKLEVISDDSSVEHLALLDLNSEDGLSEAQRVAIVQAGWLQTGEDYSNVVNWAILNHLPIEDAMTRQSVNCALMVARAWAAIGLATIDVARPTPQAFAVSPVLRHVWTRRN